MKDGYQTNHTIKMAGRRVLSKEILAGFDKYKYCSIDTNPLSNYVMHPFWNWVVELYPKWLAPNVLTFTGFLQLLLNFSVLMYYDLDFYASSRDHTECPPIPGWVWVLCAINNFVSHTLDGTDGKQARRTGSSSPLGELFDHGLDSSVSFFLPVAMYSVFGRGEHGVEVFRVFLVLIGVNFCFLASHWEKYNTGVLYLPWGYDIGMVGLSGLYLVTYFLGYEFWKLTIFGFTSAEMFEITMYAAFALSLPISLWNIYIGYRDKTGKMLSFSESVRPLVSSIILFTLMIVWARYTSYDVLYKHPRIYYWTTGMVFSNIACRLIIAQMSCTRCELINHLLVPLFTIVLTVCFLDLGVLEFYILAAYSAYITFSHVYFGYNVVIEMCEHFKINAFTIKPIES